MLLLLALLGALLSAPAGLATGSQPTITAKCCSGSDKGYDVTVTNPAGSGVAVTTVSGADKSGAVTNATGPSSGTGGGYGSANGGGTWQWIFNSPLQPGQTATFHITTNPSDYGGTFNATIGLNGGGTIQQDNVQVTQSSTPPKGLIVTKKIIDGDRVSNDHYDQDTTVTFEITVFNPNNFDVTHVAITDNGLFHKDNTDTFDTRKFTSHLTIPAGCDRDQRLPSSAVFECEDLVIPRHHTLTLRMTMKFNTYSIGGTLHNIAAAEHGRSPDSERVPYAQDAISLSLVHLHQG